MKSLIYSETCEYAVRAMVHLARYPINGTGGFIARKEIARQQHIPLSFLLKVLQRLAHHGLVQSNKGPRAGFALRRDPCEVRLIDVVRAIDGVAVHEKCAMGYGSCTCESPCSMHMSWNAVRTEIEVYLQTTIADVADERSPNPVLPRAQGFASTIVLR